MLATLYQHSDRALVRCGLAMSIVLIISFIAGAVYPSSVPPSDSSDIYARDIMLGANRGETFSRIVEQNLFVLASVFGGVVTAGFTTVLQLAWNGFRIGLLVRHYDPWILAVLVIPHATLEFAALLLGATTSIWLVLRTIMDAIKNEFYLVRNLRRIIPYVAFCAGLILLGAIVEVYITPLIGAHFLQK